MTAIIYIRNKVYGSLIAPESRVAIVLIGAWIASMVLTPIAKWTIGSRIMAYDVALAAILQVTAATYLLYRSWGLRKTFIATTIVIVVTWLAEAIGAETGFPFGNYYYTDLLQPKLLGVPILIPIAWMMMIPTAWAIAQVTLHRFRNSRLYLPLYVLTSAIALTAWDLFLDPQMVRWGFWVWENPSGYFGIPWSNYFGWLLVSAIATLLVRPSRLNPKALILMYGVVWFLQSFGQFFFFDQPGPAIVGGVVMGSIFFFAFRNRNQHQET